MIMKRRKTQQKGNKGNKLYKIDDNHQHQTKNLICTYINMYVYGLEYTHTHTHTY